MCGFAIIDTVPDNAEQTSWSPSVINLYTDTAVWVMKYDGREWSAVEFPHKILPASPSHIAAADCGEWNLILQPVRSSA